MYVLATVIVIILIIVIMYNYDMRKLTRNIDKNSRLIETKSGVIECSISGEGIPVIISHGGAGGYDQGQITGKVHLDDRFKVIAVSRFGHLRTPLPEDCSAIKQADAYAGLLDELGIKEAAILGTSGGGPSAIQFAQRHPNRCMALILSCAVSQYLPERSLEGYKHPFAYWIITKFFRKLVLKQIGVSTDLYKTLSSDEKEVINSLFKTMNPIKLRREGLLVEVPEWGDSATWESNYRLNEIAVPTLVIHAVDDTVVPYKHGEDAKRLIPNAVLISLPHGGHLKLKHGKRIIQETSQFIYDNERRI